MLPNTAVNLLCKFEVTAARTSLVNVRDYFEDNLLNVTECDLAGHGKSDRCVRSL